MIITQPNLTDVHTLKKPVFGGQISEMWRKNVIVFNILLIFWIIRIFRIFSDFLYFSYFSDLKICFLFCFCFLKWYLQGILSPPASGIYFVT